MYRRGCGRFDAYWPSLPGRGQRNEPAPPGSRLAHSSRGVLRPMDSRRKIFRFSVTRQYMGPCRKEKFTWKHQWPTRPVDLRADEFLFAFAQQRWQKAVRGGRFGAWGVGSL